MLGGKWPSLRPLTLSGARLSSSSSSSTQNEATNSDDLVAAERRARIFAAPRKQSDLVKERMRQARTLKAKLAKNMGFRSLQKFPPTYHKVGTAEVPEIEGDLVYGIHPVRQALLSNRRRPTRLFLKFSSDELGPDGTEGPGSPAFRANILREILAMARNKGVPITTVSPHLLDYLITEGRRAHQGIALEATPLRPQLYMDMKAELLQEMRSSESLWLFAEKVRDPMNLGGLIRSGYFLGASRIIVPAKGHAPLSPTVSKASAGVMELVPLIEVPSAPAFLREARVRGCDVVGAVGAGEASDGAGPPVESADVFEMRKTTILAVGSEGGGLSDEARAELTRRVCVEADVALAPGFDSLNVTVAAALLLFALRRSRRLVKNSQSSSISLQEDQPQ